LAGSDHSNRLARGLPARRARLTRASLGLALGLLTALRCNAARAQDAPLPLHVRTTLGVAMMVSTDQVGRLGYDSMGLLGGVQLGYGLRPWFAVQLAMAGGSFFSKGQSGGLLVPAIGVTAMLPGGLVAPYAFFDVGPGFTGELTRPFLSFGGGLDFAVSRALGLGPALGYDQLFQSDAPGSSTDARFLWFGLSLSFKPNAAPEPSMRHELRVHEVTHTTEHARWVSREPPPPLPDPSPELLRLIDDAVPTSQVELLAPVLFRFDSDLLEPVGVAMLHEVARELDKRPELELLEIRGYADSRGSAEHNLALSARRAERVRTWLIEHGVDEARLRTAPEGASSFVEPGSTESEHAQNRRVVFRVVQASAP